MSNPRPCAYCGHGEFLLLPSVSLDLAKATTVLGLSAYAGIAGQWEGNVVVCTRCTHTMFFTLNGPTMMKRVPGATLVKAEGG